MTKNRNYRRASGSEQPTARRDEGESLPSQCVFTQPLTLALSPSEGERESLFVGVSSILWFPEYVVLWQVSFARWTLFFERDLA